MREDLTYPDFLYLTPSEPGSVFFKMDRATPVGGEFSRQWGQAQKRRMEAAFALSGLPFGFLSVLRLDTSRPNDFVLSSYFDPCGSLSSRVSMMTQGAKRLAAIQVYIEAVNEIRRGRTIPEAERALRAAVAPKGRLLKQAAANFANAMEDKAKEILLEWGPGFVEFDAELERDNEAARQYRAEVDRRIEEKQEAIESRPGGFGDPASQEDIRTWMSLLREKEELACPPKGDTSEAERDRLLDELLDRDPDTLTKEERDFLNLVFQEQEALAAQKGGGKKKALTARQRAALKAHAPHHSRRHLVSMVRAIEQGQDFNQAHATAIKEVGGGYRRRR